MKQTEPVFFFFSKKEKSWEGEFKDNPVEEAQRSSGDSAKLCIATSPPCSASQGVDAMLQTVELHPGRHHARVLEGGLLDLPVPHMVCLDLFLSLHRDSRAMSC